MRKFLLVFLLSFTFLAPHAFASVAVNSGFIPGQIWYSKDPLVEGDTVSIYTAVWNSDVNPLSVKVEFYDKDVILGTRDIVVSSSQLKDVSISWKVTSGDHSISAKIISSSVTASGKKQNIIIDNSTTTSDKIFIPVSIKTADGKPATSSDIISNEIGQVGSKVSDILPTSVSEPISNGFGAVDDFRDTSYNKITDAKDAAQKEIDSLNSKQPSNSKIASVHSTTKPLDATQKPLAYLKLFFFTFLSFIFGNKIVFYGLVALIVFFVVRLIYRKIKNK